MVKLAILGSWWGGNLGDTAILKSQIALFSQFDSVEEIYLQSNSPGILSEYIKEEKVQIFPSTTNYWGRNTVRIIRESDFLIIGGGGLFFSRKTYDPFYNHLLNLYPITAVSRIFDTPFHVFSVGISHLQSRFGRWFAKQIITNSRSVSVRDQLSREYATSLKNGECEVIPDPAFALSPNRTARVESVRSHLPSKTLLLNLHKDMVKYSEYDSECIASKVANTLSDYAIENEYGILLLNNYIFEDWILNLRNYIDDRIEVHTLNHDKRYSPEEVIGILESVDKAVCSQMHMNIFALIAGVPSVGIEYDQKVPSMFSQFGLEGQTISVEDATSTRKLIESIEHSTHPGKTRLNDAERQLQTYISNHIVS